MTTDRDGTRPIDAGALHSDHVNYLIFRYLQEHGHEKTATEFFKEWHRPYEFRDPEALPFAPIVRRGELVSVVQCGLWHDEVLAQARGSATGATRDRIRQFRWTAVNPRERLPEGFDLDEIQFPERIPRVARDQSSVKRKPRPAVDTTEATRASDEFPTPPPKRVRRSEGSDAVHVNGDADNMDVDSPSVVEGDEDAEGEPVSPEEPELAEVPERYDSLDVATQTDVKFAPKTSTLSWTLERPNARILQSLWSPKANADDRKPHALLLAGEGLCRFYDVPAIPSDSGAALHLAHIDDPHFPSDSTVTAAAWHRDGESVVLAVDVQTDVNRPVTQQLLIKHVTHSGSSVFGSGPLMLEPPGLTICMRYSPSYEYLLVLRTNLQRTIVQIWDMRSASTPGGPSAGEESPAPSEPMAWRIFEHDIVDACWINDDAFVTVSENGPNGKFVLDQPMPPTPASFNADSVESHGIREEVAQLVASEPTWTASRVLYTGPELDTLLFVPVSRSDFASTLIAVPASVTSTSEAQEQATRHELSTLTGITDIVLAPRPTSSATSSYPSSPSSGKVNGVSSSDSANYLAVAYEDGACHIHHLSRDPGQRQLQCSTTHTLSTPPLDTSLALTWAPDGRHLAVAGDETLSIFKTPLHEEAQSDAIRLPIVRWRFDEVMSNGSPQSATKAGAENGSLELPAPCVNWTADGQRLVFGVQNRVAVISFRPPLARAVEDASDAEDDQS